MIADNFFLYNFTINFPLRIGRILWEVDFLQRGHLELDNNLLFKSKPAPTGTFNGEIQTLYDKWKFALIKQKLFRENQPTNRELAQMAGAHKNEKVIFIPTDKGIKFLGHKVVPEKLL